MNKLLRTRECIVGMAILGVFSAPLRADDILDRLVNDKKYDEAVHYADDKLPPASRDADAWTQIAKADEALNLPEKALACFMVASRLDPKDYDALLGAAKLSNKLDQPESAADFAGKALALNYSAEAAWQYASACIKLNRVADAKQALTKVVQADSQNVMATRELGAIYFHAGEFEKAALFLRKSFALKADADVAFLLGKTYLATGATDSAAVFFKEATAKNPSLYDADLELARLYFKTGKFPEAAMEYGKIRAKVDLIAMDNYNMAISFDKMNSPDSAFVAYVAAADKFGNLKGPESLQSHAKAGDGFLEKKNYEAALRHFQIVAALDPQAKTIKDLYFLLAEAFEGAGKKAQAFASLEKAVSLDKNNIEAYARLADMLEKNHQPEKARLVYNKMMALFPKDPHVYQTLGDYDLKAKKYADALLNFENAYTLDHSALSAQGVAKASEALGNWDKAVAMYRKAVMADPQNIEANKGLGMALMKMDSTVDALEYLEVANALSPNDPEILILLSQGYIQTNRPQEAIDVLKRVKALKPVDPEIRMQLADLYQKSGQNALALEEMKGLLEIKRDNKLLLTYARELVSAGKYKEAEDAVQNIRATDPENIEALMVLGSAQRSEKKYDDAIETYKEISSINLNYAPANFQRAEIYLLLDKVQWAKTFYERALEADPKLAMAELGLAKIAKITGNQNDYRQHLDKAMMLDPANNDIKKEFANLKEKPDPHDIRSQ